MKLKRKYYFCSGFFAVVAAAANALNIKRNETVMIMAKSHFTNSLESFRQI